MQRFTELKVWQRAHALALDIYKLSKAFPDEERFGLTSQARRAAVSVCANIAEGSKRTSPGDYARLLNIAQGSATELEALLMLARDIGHVSSEHVAPALDELNAVCRMLEALRRAVDRGAGRPSTSDTEPSTDRRSPAAPTASREVR